VRGGVSYWGARRRWAFGPGLWPKEAEVPCGRKRKLRKIATHKRKKKLRKNRHKNK
jgi:hypothetical protein